MISAFLLVAKRNSNENPLDTCWKMNFHRYIQLFYGTEIFKKNPPPDFMLTLNGSSLSKLPFEIA